MELRRAADALIRCNASPLSNLLIPSSNIRRASRRQLTSKYTYAPPSQRNFVTSNRCNAVRSQATTSAPPTTPESESTTGEASKDPAKNDEIIEQLSGNLWTQRPSPTSSPYPKLSSLQAAIRSSETDSSSMLNELRQASANRAPDSNRFDISRMKDPPSSTTGEAGTTTYLDLMRGLDGIAPSAAVQKIPLRLNPTQGRRVYVTQSFDVGRAFKSMELNLKKNKVKMDFNNQRYHERPGLKRKRLASYRWRRNFKEGFKATVNRVKQLKHQGW